MSNSKILSGLVGVCVGDALGFPVQFASRQERVNDPVTGMTSHRNFGLDAGIWSDDSSLTFCLAEALCDGFDLGAIAHNFVRWRYDGYWTPHGRAFDVGSTTNKAMYNLQQGVSPTESGGTGEWSNGNGSLMRILPMDEISSSGYVIHTLEAALWSLLTTSSFSEALLKVVNLGDDTDTVGAVAGGLAGIYYGFDKMPSEWIEVLARKEDIVELAKRLETVYG